MCQVGQVYFGYTQNKNCQNLKSQKKAKISIRIKFPAGTKRISSNQHIYFQLDIFCIFFLATLGKKI
jgi:hypothetical protein